MIGEKLMTTRIYSLNRYTKIPATEPPLKENDTRNNQLWRKVNNVLFELHCLKIALNLYGDPNFRSKFIASIPGG